jgi:hypothetical protein
MIQWNRNDIVQSCAVTDAFRFGRARRNGATSNRGHAGTDTQLPVPKFIEVGTVRHLWQANRNRNRRLNSPQKYRNCYGNRECIVQSAQNHVFEACAQYSAPP